MTSKLYKTSYHDCNTVVVAALLHNHKPIASKYFWKQAGLYIIDHNNFLEVSPFYKRINDELSNVGVEMCEGVITTSSPIDFILSKLKEKSNFGVRLNAFELPYSNSYQKEHNFHSIEILNSNLKEKNFYVLDHFYRYEGVVSFDAIEKALLATENTWKDYPEYFYFNLIPEKELDTVFDKNYLRNALQSNLSIMEGKTDDINIDNNSTIIGFEAIDYLKNHIDYCLANQDKISLDYLFESLRSVANSRYNFAITLANYNETELSDLYKDAYQRWIVISNLILRSMVKGDFERTRPRIENSFTRLKQFESYLLDNIKDYFSFEGNKNNNS